MAAPQFVPSSPVDKPRSYESPDHVPESVAGRPSGRGDRPPAGRAAARLPGAGPGLRAAAGRAVPGPVAPAIRRGRPTTPSRDASAWRCGGRRSSGGRRPSTTSPWPSRSGASSIPSPPAELVTLRAPAVRGRAQHVAPLRRGPGHRRRGAGGDAAQVAQGGGERVSRLAGGSCSALELRRAGAIVRRRRHRGRDRRGVGGLRAGSGRAARWCCWSRRSSSPTTPPADRPRSSSRATARRRCGR